jgi:hypothetical protein
MLKIHSRTNFILHNIFRKSQVKKTEMGRWAEYVAHMREKRGAYRVLVGKPGGRRPLERHRHEWEDNIKMDL